MAPSRFPPGPSNGLALLKEFRSPTAQRLDLMRELHRTHGDLAHVSILGQHVYLLGHPDYIRYVLTEAPEKFGQRKIGQQALDRNPKRIADATAFHRRQRKLIQPAFTPARVGRYATVMVDYTLQLMAEWANEPQRNLTADLNTLTLRIVSKALYDVDISDKTGVFQDAIQRGITFLSGQNNAPLWIPTPANLKLIGAWLNLEKTVKEIIAERRASGIDRGDLLSAILSATDGEGGSPLTEKEAYDTISGLFIAGNETVSHALTWTWHLLTQHPEVEERLIAELRNFPADATLTPADLDRLPYTDNVIRESMRLYPPAWVIERYTLEPVELGGYTLPPGSLLYLSPYLMHRDERYFPNPDQFQPERWENDLIKKLPSHTYFPFGGGPHVCTGQFFALLEARLLLATIARRAHIVGENTAAISGQPLITLRPIPDVQVSVEWRNV